MSNISIHAHMHSNFQSYTGLLSEKEVDPRGCNTPYAAQELWMRIMNSLDMQSLLALSNVCKSLSETKNRYFEILTKSKDESVYMQIWLKNLPLDSRKQALSSTFPRLVQTIPRDGLTFENCTTKDLAYCPKGIDPSKCLPKDMTNQVMEFATMRSLIQLTKVNHDWLSLVNLFLNMKMQSALNLQETPKNELKFYRFFLSNLVKNGDHRKTLLACTMDQLISLNPTEGQTFETYCAPYLSLVDLAFDMDRVLSVMPQASSPSFDPSNPMDEKSLKELFSSFMEVLSSGCPDFDQAACFPFKMLCKNMINNFSADCEDYDAILGIHNYLRLISEAFAQNTLSSRCKQEVLKQIAAVYYFPFFTILITCRRAYNSHLSLSLFLDDQNKMKNLALYYFVSLIEDIIDEPMKHIYSACLSRLIAKQGKQEDSRKTFDKIELFRTPLNKIEIKQMVQKSLTTLSFTQEFAAFISSKEYRVLLHQYMDKNLSKNINRKDLFEQSEPSLNLKGAAWLLESVGFLERSKRASE